MCCIVHFHENHLFFGVSLTAPYDGVGNLTSIVYGDGKTVALSYNPANELTAFTDWNGTTSYELDVLGRITAVNDANGNQVGYTYDGNGNQTGIAYPDGSQAVYEYNQRNQISRITMGASQVWYEYDEKGRMIRTQSSDGSVVEQEYDQRDRILRVLENGVEAAGYTYDGAGNLLVSHESYGGKQRSSSYVYDPNNRLITAVAYGDGRLQTDYRYDSLGNLVKETERRGAAVTETAYTYNSLNQLLRKGDQTYEYDRRGNLIREKNGSGGVAASYQYDGTNRMTAGTTEQGTSTYRYDGLGRLVGHNDRTYVADALSPIDLPLSILTDQGTASYGYGMEGAAMIQYQGMVHFVSTDRLGSIRSIRTTNGSEIAGFTYDAWGRPVERMIASGYEGGPLSEANYTGHHYDGILGQYYAKARMYSPGMKQFTSIDPARNGRNWTGYSLENPLRFIDLTGMAAQSISDLTVWDVRDSLRERNYLKAYAQVEMIKIDIIYSGVNAGAHAVLGESVAILESSARGASFLGRVTVGNLFPGTKKYFYRFDCGIYKAENWIRENIVTDPESYGFAKGVTEKYILPIYGAAKVVEGGYHLYQNYGGSVKNFMMDETGSVRIPGGKGTGQITSGKNVKSHYKDHKGLLETITGKKYPSFKQSNNAQEFLQDLTNLVDDGTFQYVYKSTAQQGGDILNVYKGEGLVLALKENGEWVTLLTDGQGLAKALELFKILD